MRYLGLILILGISLLLNTRLRAQENVLLSLGTAATEIQTGESYELNIQLENVSELWLATLQIHYDPSMLYIWGAKAGSPVQQGNLFSTNTSAVLQNQVERDFLSYSLSMLAPAEPITGSGTVGSFRIYPLRAGQTQIVFSRAELTRALFEERDGQRLGIGSESLTFMPVLLELNVAGASVEPPSEATATPAPSQTPFVFVATQDFPTAEPTLLNVTAAPRTPEPISLMEAPNAKGSEEPLLFLAIGMIAIGASGTLTILFLMKRKR